MTETCNDLHSQIESHVEVSLYQRGYKTVFENEYRVLKTFLVGKFTQKNEISSKLVPETNMGDLTGGLTLTLVCLRSSFCISIEVGSTKRGNRAAQAVTFCCEKC